MPYPPIIEDEHQILGTEYCSGYMDVYQKWNTGFDCPPQSDSHTEIFCCGLPTFKYCCTIKDTEEPPPFSDYIPKTPLALAGLTLMTITITFASCFFCSCLVYKTRKRQGISNSGGLYRLQDTSGSTLGAILCSPSTTNQSLITTPLENEASFQNTQNDLNIPVSNNRLNNSNNNNNNSTALYHTNIIPNNQNFHQHQLQGLGNFTHFPPSSVFSLTSSASDSTPNSLSTSSSFQYLHLPLPSNNISRPLNNFHIIRNINNLQHNNSVPLNSNVSAPHVPVISGRRNPSILSNYNPNCIDLISHPMMSSNGSGSGNSSSGYVSASTGRGSGSSNNSIYSSSRDGNGGGGRAFLNIPSSTSSSSSANTNSFSSGNNLSLIRSQLHPINSFLSHPPPPPTLPPPSSSNNTVTFTHNNFANRNLTEETSSGGGFRVSRPTANQISNPLENNSLSIISEINSLSSSNNISIRETRKNRLLSTLKSNLKL